jgi:hypothetical protein
MKGKTMAARPRFILPAVNVALAVILLGIGYIPPIVYSTPRSWELAFSINAPANLFRNLVWFEWSKHISPHCSVANSEACIKAERGIETAAFLLCTVFVWYVVGLEVEASRCGTRAMARFVTPARVLLDLIFFSAGALFLFLSATDWRSLHILNYWTALNFLLYAIWALVLAIAYGRDLVRCAVAILKAR